VRERERERERELKKLAVNNKSWEETKGKDFVKMMT
jgi:hypothetical protein